MDFGFGDDAKTIFVCPSISFPAVELRKITGIQHYEERMLFMLLALEDPDTRVVYVTSLPIDPAIIEYYLSFLSDPGPARERLCLVTLDDPEERALTAKLLERPELVDKIRAALGGPEGAFLLPFNVTSWEGALCERLGLRLYGPPPALTPLGSKSGGRRIARDAGVSVADGAEDLWSVEETSDAVNLLFERRQDVSAAVVKLNNGFSGQGNAIVERSDFRPPLPSSPTTFCAQDESWTSFSRKIAAGGAVIEELVRARGLSSPSVQMRALPTGALEVTSTHDQILGGPDDQVYLGCRFPARSHYRQVIRDDGLRIAEALAARGVIGSFGVDFLVVPEAGTLRSYMSEINLRVGGTTHPFVMAQLASGGRYDPATGELVAGGSSKCYVATDNLKSQRYLGLSPCRVIEGVSRSGLAFDAARSTGVMLHLLGSLPRFGKLGATCLADSHDDADALHADLVGLLDGLGSS